MTLLPVKPINLNSEHKINENTDIRIKMKKQKQKWIEKTTKTIGKGHNDMQGEKTIINK